MTTKIGNTGVEFPDATLQATAAESIGAVSNTQTFTTSGTWTKPAAGTIARLKMWGAGGSGGRDDTNYKSAGGGGGGGYIELLVPLSLMGSTEAVTIGAGGSSRTSDSSGEDGGDSLIGDWMSAGGKKGHRHIQYQTSSGYIESMSGGDGGESVGSALISTVINSAPSSSSYPPALQISTGFNGGGPGGYGGGSYSDRGTGYRYAQDGGDAINGGAGGGGGSDHTANTYIGDAGTSTNGGDGGIGGYHTTAATAGTAPGGGGGGAHGAASGAGAAGQIIVEVF